MPQGYDGLPFYYTQSANPITPNLNLSLKGLDPIAAEDFVLIDNWVGALVTSIQVNGAPVSNPNFINSVVVFSVVGSNISAALANSGVTAGSYTNTNLTVNASGLITAASSGSSYGIFPLNVVTKTSNYTAVAGDFIKCDTSGGGFTVLLPLSALNYRETVVVKKISTDTNILTIANSGADTIDGVAGASTATPETAVEMVADGTATWEIY